MTNRNAYSNATRCGTYYRRCSACRCAPRLRASRLYSTQRFVCYFFTASLRNLTQRYASMRNSTQRFVCYTAAPLCASLRAATHLNAPICLLQRAESLRGSPPLHSTQRFVCYFFIAATYLNSLRLNAPLLNATRLCASPLTSTQRFVCYRRNSTCLHSTQLKPTNPIGEQNVPKIATNNKTLRNVSQV